MKSTDSLRRNAAGIFIMSLGLVINLLYWWLKPESHNMGLIEHFWMSPEAHILMLLLIPIMGIVGYQMIKERRLREELERARQREEQSRKKLHEFFRELEKILHTVPAAVITTNGDGLINFFNRRAMEYLGRGDREILGTRIWEYFKEPEVKETIRNVLEGKVKKELINMEATLPTGKTVQLLIAPVPDARGGVEGVGVVVSLLDITRLKRLLSELEETSRMKGLFLDILRHDLLNPAGVINNYIDLMLEDAGKDEEGDLLAMKRAVEKILTTIEDAAQFARLESIKPRFEELDLDEILKRVVEDFKPLLNEAGMQVEYRSPGKMPVHASPIIYDVFANLLSNAIKYAKEGKKVIIEAEDAGDSYIVRVKDFGEGVPDEFKEPIFERFKRREKRGVKGTGLGLAIVKRIAELHSGKVWVEDNSPKGAVFVVEIPKRQVVNL